MAEAQRENRSWRSAIDMVANVLTVVASIAVLVVLVRGMSHTTSSQNSGNTAVPKELLSLEGAQLTGNPSARAVLVEYSDFECPFCGKFAREILPDIERKYVDSGNVLFAFRQYPLEQRHKSAKLAAEFSVCAGEQSKFSQAHDLLFKDQEHLADLDPKRFSAALGLEIGQFSACLPTTGQKRVAEDVSSGKALKFRGTPTFFVGVNVGGGVQAKVAVSGAQPLMTFEGALDTVLQSSK